MKSKHIIVVLSILLVSFSSARAQLEVWINPVGTDGTGTGTAADPYVCSSEATFDALMAGSAIPASSTIHLMPGTFLTEGNIPIKSGWKFRGAGIDATTIQLINLGTNASPYYMHVVGVDADRPGAEISDMTVDCNLQAQSGTVTIGAVILGGGNNKISRVKAINWGSEDANDENFTFLMGPPTDVDPPQTNYLIEDCIMEQPAPVIHYGISDGFVIIGNPTDPNQSNVGTNGWILGAEIRNCRIFNINPVSGGGMGQPSEFLGISIGNGVSGAKMDGNMIIDLGGDSSAAYDSCGSLVNCVIEDNMFINVGGGINFAGSDSCPGNTNSLKENIVISDNFISVQSGGYGLGLSGIFGSAITNLTVNNNIVQAASGAGAINGLIVAQTDNLNAQNNVLDANGGTALEIATNVIVAQIINNQSLSGASITTPLWQATNTAGFFVGDGSGLTGITADQVNAAASTNALIWNSLTVTNSSATNWATLSVTPSNAVISVKGQTVAILQTNGVLNAYNGLSTTISNTAPASSTTLTMAISGPGTPDGFSWTNTTSANIVAYIDNASFHADAYNVYYNGGSPIFTNVFFATVMLQPNSYLSVSNSSIGSAQQIQISSHPF